jgi:hypothetical protein
MQRVGGEMDVAGRTWRRTGMANHCRPAKSQGSGRELESFREQTKQRKREQQRQSEPRAPDETEAGFEKHRPGSAMQADIEERRARMSAESRTSQTAPERIATMSASKIRTDSRLRSG